MLPVDLKKLFGDRHRVGLDESARYEPGGKKDLWYFLLLCRHGSIYPFSSELLAFHCMARGIRTLLHRDHLEIEVRNWSDDGEAIFLFRPDKFDLVAEYAKPKRKRRLSVKQRQTQVERLRDYRFKPKTTQVNATKTAPKGAISGKSTKDMAEAEIGDSGSGSPHFMAGDSVNTRTT